MHHRRVPIETRIPQSIPAGIAGRATNLSARMRRCSARSAFTLVETMTAVVVLTIGVLGLAATAAVVTRTMSNTAREGAAVTVASSRVERIASGDCAAMLDSSGTDTSLGVSERWTVRPTSRSIVVVESVAYVGYGRRRVQVHRAELPCERP